jgi:hypothetical protein
LKTCAICKTPKELTEFHKRGPSREGKFNSYCKPCRSARRKAEHLALKVETFNQYGGIICSCCGETEFCFLALDHINNNGNKHRKLINNGRGGLTFYAKLKVLGFPSGFQVLCHNCNVGKYVNGGICPHKGKHVSTIARV